jgi:2'-5' RNA ligase
MPRLFVGLEIPSAIGQRLAMLSGALGGARWVDPEDYHITLRFIGDIAPRLADEVDDMLRLLDRPPVPVKVIGLDAFGGDKPSSIHAKVEASRALDDLQAEVERLVRGAGVPPEKRRFVPHVTLARFSRASAAEVAGHIAGVGYVPSQTFTATRVVLYSSRASVGGGPYVAEAVYPLVRSN